MLVPLAEGVFCDSEPVRVLGMRLTATMTVLTLDRGGLLLHSPVPLTPERRAAVTALGRVEHLYAPNTFHHLWIGEWSRAFPKARVHAPPGLVKQRPDLRIGRVHGGGEPIPSELIEEVPIRGFALEESVLVYRPARVAVLADLVHNVGRPTHTWTKLYTRAMGFYDRVALSRAIRWTAFTDRSEARRSVDRLLAQNFEHLIVGHGAPITSAAREVLAQALDFLPALSAPRLVASAKRRGGPVLKPCG
jgi:hypothetical protein